MCSPVSPFFIVVSDLFYIHFVLCLLLWILISSCNRHKAWICNLINNKKETPHFIPTLRPRNRTWPVVRSPWAYGSLSSTGSFLFLPEVITILTFQIISLLFCFVLIPIFLSWTLCPSIITVFILSYLVSFQHYLCEVHPIATCSYSSFIFIWFLKNFIS